MCQDIKKFSFDTSDDMVSILTLQVQVLERVANNPSGCAQVKGRVHDYIMESTRPLRKALADISSVFFLLKADGKLEELSVIVKDLKNRTDVVYDQLKTEIEEEKREGGGKKEEEIDWEAVFGDRL